MKKLTQIIKDELGIIFGNQFFTSIKTEEISEKQWRIFFLQKYGSVGYFLDFLKNGSTLALPYSKLLSKVFLQNYNDETGFVNGMLLPEYSHETWRMGALTEFGIQNSDLANVVQLNSTKRHGEMIVHICKEKDFLEYAGMLLFLEIFVVWEMRALIDVFERTMPNHFSKGGYDETLYPLNTHEYWYSHRTHDVEHFKQIKNGLLDYLNTSKTPASDTARILRGINKCAAAKMHLYDQELFAHMMKG